MKRVLIISPYFVPVNAADMQRVRMSLPYYEDHGWEEEVVTIDPTYSDLPVDHLLEESVPNHIQIYKVAALAGKWTNKIGIGSIALRSLWHYRKAVNKLLKKKRYDLIFFSTTQFPILVLGAYWKKKFGVPYIIDMQDPWHSDYYRDKKKSERPKKYWFSYRLNKYLEPLAMRSVGGLISVSEGYLVQLKKRYPILIDIPMATITFGAFKPDLEIALRNKDIILPNVLPGRINVVYIGRGGNDMSGAIDFLVKAIKESKLSQEQIHFYFIGTSYAPTGTGIPTIKPLADREGLADYFTEITDRIPYYQSLNLLIEADAIFIPGSDDVNYTASKIFPALLAASPLMAIFHSNSSATKIIKDCSAGVVFTFDQSEPEIISGMCKFLFDRVARKTPLMTLNKSEFGKYSAETLTNKQVSLFNLVINNH